MKIATLAVHAGAPSGANAPVTTPIVQSTTFRFESAEAVQRYNASGSGFMYSRYQNPTVLAAEQALAAIEGAEACVLFASGMGAMATAVMSLVSAGDEVPAATALYGGTYKLLRDVLSRFGVRARMGEPEAQVAYDLLRGLKTFAVRLERQCASALTIARWLSEQRAVERVWYPGLPSHPDHELARRQMNGFGGMVTFTVGTREKAFRFWDRLKLVARAASLGGPETLTSLPILFSHTGYSAEELRRAGVDEGMVRMSVGLEDPEDLIADLRQALE